MEHQKKAQQALASKFFQLATLGTQDFSALPGLWTTFRSDLCARALWWLRQCLTKYQGVIRAAILPLLGAAPSAVVIKDESALAPQAN